MAGLTMIRGAVRWVAITKSDSVDIPARPAAVYVGQAGSIEALDWTGNAETFYAVPAGTILPIRPKRITASGSSAAFLLALYNDNNDE